MGDIFPILLGVLVLAGLVTAVMGYKSWPIYTIILLIFNLSAAAGFIYLSARTMKTYHVWRTEVKDWETTVKEKSKEVDDKLYGAGEDNDAIPLADLKTRLRLALTQRRSRAWGLLDADTRTNVLNNQPPISATINSNGNVVTAELTWRLPTPPKDLGLEPKMTVFLFGDSQADASSAGYYGKYIIDSVDAKSLKLTRTEATYPGEPVMFNNRPVIIYDNFPNDDYRTFAGKTLADLQRLLPDVPPATLEQFVKHGKPVTAAEEQALLEQAAIDDQAKTELATLNKAQVWYRVRVKQPIPVSELSGKAAPAAAPAPMPGENGEPMPMAEEALPATFAVGTKIVLDPDTAKKLVGEEKAEFDGADYRVYMRPLRDYPSEYKRIRENFVDLTAAIAEVERLMSLNAMAQKSTEETIKQHEARTTLVKEDLANLRKETAALTGYEAQIRQRLAAVQQERAAALSEIGKLAAAVTQYQLEALQKVHARSADQAQAAATP